MVLNQDRNQDDKHFLFVNIIAKIVVYVFSAKIIHQQRFSFEASRSEMIRHRCTQFQSMTSFVIVLEENDMTWDVHEREFLSDLLWRKTFHVVFLMKRKQQRFY